jgi:hypothetical protein
MKHRIVTGILQIRFTASHLRQVVNVCAYDCNKNIQHFKRKSADSKGQTKDQKER